ncbi:MAG: hypothetical protein IPK10_02605 [Bacteroidetes bacterium]|nr:hypothetical protein [Bacteroidota bacterium]
MASAKNKKKAVATKKVIKKPAPKKAAKPIVKKSVKKVAVKKVVKKAASAKPAAKVKNKITTKKAATLTKKSTPAPKKKVASKIPVKKVASQQPTKKVVSKESVRKENSKSIASKVATKVPVKAEKLVKVELPKVSVKKEKKPLDSKTKKQEVDKKIVGKSGKPIETIDPLHAKAAKVMKELEETMDLSKMRPRIQAGTAPKPLPKKSDPLPNLPEPTNTNKEKYTLEFEFRSSPKILFTSLSDSSGLAGWFADEVRQR